MKFIYNGNSKKSGVYKILNQKNGKFYIGSCKEFKSRAKEHLRALRAGRHRNKHLQASFDKHGQNVFTFEVVKVVEDEPGTSKNRKDAEQHLLNSIIDINMWESCFNFQKKVIGYTKRWSSTPGTTKQKLSERSKLLWKDSEYRKKVKIGYKESWTDERKQIRSEHSKILWNDNKTRSRIQNAMKGKKRTEEHKMSIANANSKAWTFMSPTNEIITIYNLRNFCRENTLSYSSMLKVAKNKLKNHNGWTREE